MQIKNPDRVERRAWAVPSDDAVPYYEFDFDQVDALCFGDDAQGHLPYYIDGDARITIPNLVWPLYTDQAMVALFEHLRRGKR